MKLQICRPNYLRRGGQEGSDERQFLHDGADNARILATPDTGHTCHVALHTCHTLGQWSQSYPLLPRTVKWIQMDVLQPQSPLKNSGARFCWWWPGLGAGSCWRLGSGVNLVMSWFMKTGDSSTSPARPLVYLNYFISVRLQRCCNINPTFCSLMAGEGDLMCSLFQFMFTTLNRLDVCSQIF